VLLELAHADAAGHLAVKKTEGQLQQRAYWYEWKSAVAFHCKNCRIYFVGEFNRTVSQTNETFKSYIARLSSLLSYYVKSRSVHDFDELCQLLVCDRVKSVLPEGA